MSKTHPPLALIAGPTASGKSALALALAERTGGVIVNADSAQVYADLPILSAAPSEADRKRAEHRLYNYLDGAEPSSAADWATRAKAEIADIHASGRLPILAGGSGLYIKTLLEGIAPVPPIDPAVRQEVRSAEAEDNLNRLRELDSAGAAKLNPGDTARIARALEVVLASGKPLSHWQAQPREGGIEGTVELRPIVLLPPREWLNAQCERRFVAMVNDGAVAEVKALLKRKLPPSMPVMQAIGVREIAAHLAGRITLAQAANAGVQTTRNYAKRQYTWLRNQPPGDWPIAIEPMRTPDAIERGMTTLGAGA